MPEDYDDRYKEWRIEDLPIAPPAYKYKTKEDTKRQYKKIEKLLQSHQWDRVIVATDAGREGELIGRLILYHAGFRD
jgi:DNA topoisomerase-3